MSRTFQDVVADALDSIPTALAAHLDNVVVVVEDEPSADDLRTVDLSSGAELFGLYHGTPITERGLDYTFALPDRIVIYEGPLVRAFGSDPEQLEREIAVTVVHEIAHAFGIDEETLTRLGWG